VDSVVAIATPPGESALAVIRVTGSNCLEMIQRIAPGCSPKPRKAIHVLLKNPTNTSLLDDVVLLYYKAPASYTGEDMFEIFCHGGFVTVQNIFESLIDIGCRPAPPGEFTKRAVLNGKMDIFQAESVEQIVRARSAKEVQLSLQTLQGKLSQTFHQLLQRFTELQIEIEAKISFPDDIHEDDTSIFKELHALSEEIQKHIQSFAYIKKIQSGFSLVLMGRTNVGKSTLFNALVGFDRTLVSPYPSTTHDYVSEEVLWDGYSVHIYDTAGYISNPTHPLDQLFNERMASLFDSSSILVYVIDTEDFQKDDLSLIHQYANSNMMIVINKTDISSPDPLWIQKLPKHIPMFEVSAKNKTGIESIIHHITTMIKQTLDAPPDYYVNERHHAVLVHLQQLMQPLLLPSKPFLDQVAEDLNEIVYILKEELNVSHSRKLLDEIFSHFCIGK
jgi:tRNA modification GTPase